MNLWGFRSLGRSGIRRSDGIWYKYEVPESHEITRLLQAWSEGDSAALDTLVPLIYNDLRRMAARHFRGESPRNTLQPTALVAELYLRLKGGRSFHWENRSTFFQFAGEVMRHILVDQARGRKAKKRGGGITPISLEWAEDHSSELDLDVLSLNIALEDLEIQDPRQYKIVALRFFVGLRVEEVAEVLEISTPTVKRDWRVAKLWLHRRLEDLESDEESE